MGRYLLDTNHLGAALDDRSAIRGRLFQARRAGHRLATTAPALCELHTGLFEALPDILTENWVD
jgi:predicted nucleic acid-binding protein